MCELDLELRRELIQEGIEEGRIVGRREVREDLESVAILQAAVFGCIGLVVGAAGMAIAWLINA